MIDDWRHNPFKPHLIARQRIAAYQKFVFMKYLDNLISWGDTLFRQDSFESDQPGDAALHPGQRHPRADAAADRVARGASAPHLPGARRQRDWTPSRTRSSRWSTRSSPTRPHRRTTTLEPPTRRITPIRSIALKIVLLHDPAQRLARQLLGHGAGPAVQDPEQPEHRRASSGSSRCSSRPSTRRCWWRRPRPASISAASSPSSTRRCRTIASTSGCRRRSISATSSRASALSCLSALEKKDGEDLQLLRQGHEIKLLQLVRQVRQTAGREAEGEHHGARAAARGGGGPARRVRTTGSRSTRTKLQQVSATTTSTVLETIAGGPSRTRGCVRGRAPDAKAGMVGPVPPGGGGHQDRKRAGERQATPWRQGLSTVAGVFHAQASLGGTGQAGFERRWEDFKLQERQAVKEITQINQQIAVANIRLADRAAGARQPGHADRPVEGGPRLPEEQVHQQGPLQLHGHAALAHVPAGLPAGVRRGEDRRADLPVRARRRGHISSSSATRTACTRGCSRARS